MSENQAAPLKVHKYDDEVDLVELLQRLWAQKRLIFLVTLCGFVSAVSYVYFTPEKYESKPILSPPSITAFAHAPFVRDVNVSLSSNTDLLGVALKLSDNVMLLLGRRLLAPATYASFISESPEFLGCFSTSSQGVNKVVVSVVCADKDISLRALDAYIKYASRITVQEFQVLMVAVGVEHSIQASGLYSVESPVSVSVTPRRSLVLALGLVLGGVLGLSIALARLAICWRPSQIV